MQIEPTTAANVGRLRDVFDGQRLAGLRVFEAQKSRTREMIIVGFNRRDYGIEG